MLEDLEGDRADQRSLEHRLAVGFGARQVCQHPGEHQVVCDQRNDQSHCEDEEAQAGEPAEPDGAQEVFGESGATHGGDEEGQQQCNDDADESHEVLELAHHEVVRRTGHLPHRGHAHAQVMDPAQPGPQCQQQTDGEHGGALCDGLFDDGLHQVAHLPIAQLGRSLEGAVQQFLVSGQDHRGDGEGQHEQREDGHHGEVSDAGGELVSATFRVALLHPHDVVEPGKLLAILVDEAWFVFAGAFHSVVVQLVFVWVSGGHRCRSFR